MLLILLTILMEAYIEVTIPVLDERKEIITAELVNLDYEGVWEEGMSLKGYIPKSLFAHKTLYDTLAKYGMENNFKYAEVQDKNWNEEWEKHYEPILVDDQVYVRSPFHETKQGIPFEVIIQPQMSFGTGHHETTQLMIEMMLTTYIKDKPCIRHGNRHRSVGIFEQSFGRKRSNRN